MRLAPSSALRLAAYVLVADGLGAGLRQMLLLGAGFDSRAYRLPALADARVFEVDHPATQRAKRQLVQRYVKGHGGRVVFVAADLVHDDLGETLTAQ